MIAGVQFVRVTLEVANPDVDELVLRYGTEDAIVPQNMNADDYVNDLVARAPRVIAGKPITWTLAVGSPVIMPAVAAKHHFGNWDIPLTGTMAGLTGQGSVEGTHAYEKRRLTQLWGGFETMTRTEAGADSIPNGYRNLPKIAPPRVPHVLVEALDALMQPNGDTYRPWAVFAWERDLSARPRKAAPAALEGISEATFRRMVDEAVNARMDALTAPAAGGKRTA